MDKTVVNILMRGVELDKQKRYTESIICYQEGIQILVDLMKVTSGDKKAYYRSKIEEYMARAEIIKAQIAASKESGKLHEQIAIENNSTGHSYQQLFGRFLDDDVVTVSVEDPYIKAFHQCQNFVKLTELLVKKCPSLKRLDLTTSKDQQASSDQGRFINDLKSDLSKYNIQFNVTFSTTLHDRQIILSSGWIIKIGRGLDYFKPSVSKYSLGALDMDLRPCHETTVDIFHTNFVKQRN